jgi:tRNA (cmo5U34)-methyltransferase
VGWEPDTYPDEIRVEIPRYDELQDRVVAATRGPSVSRILELGVGTGETTRRLLDAHPRATLLGIDGSADMLAAARADLPAARVELRLSRLEDPLPDGTFDLVVSVLAVHHLPGEEKAALFERVATVLVPGRPLRARRRRGPGGCAGRGDSPRGGLRPARPRQASA